MRDRKALQARAVDPLGFHNVDRPLPRAFAFLALAWLLSRNKSLERFKDKVGS